jgi:hypothetical protein
MIKKAKKNAARKPQVAVLAPVDLARVTGGDPPPMTKIKETLVGD